MNLIPQFAASITELNMRELEWLDFQRAKVQTPNIEVEISKELYLKIKETPNKYINEVI